MKKQFTILLLLSLSNIALAGGPWTQQKGKGYYKLSEWWVLFDQHYTDQGKIDPNSTTGIFNTFLYGEYGISDKFTGIFNGAIFSRNLIYNQVSAATGDIIAEGDALNSIGDIDLGIKYSLSSNKIKVPMAISVFLGIPTGNSQGGKANNLQTGDGEFNQMVQFDIGGGFNLSDKVSTYASAYSGINNRTKGFSEEFRYGVEMGAGFISNKLWLIGRLSGIKSFKNGDKRNGATSTSIFANDTEFTSVNIETNYYFTKKVGVSLSFTSAIKGEIIAAAPSYSVGFFLDMTK